MSVGVDPLSFLQIYAETMARIRARMDADVNAGVDTSSPSYVDTREGSFYFDMTQVAGLEMARLWDALTETIAAAFPATAWGEYLDNHGETFNLVRNPAVAATGVALFVGGSGIAIATGTQISTQPADPNTDAITFTTLSGGTTVDVIAGPAITVTPSLTGGTLVAGTYFYHATAYNNYGETLSSGEFSGVIASGGTGSNVLTWPAVTGANGYRIYRASVTGTLGGLIADTALLTITDTGAVAPGIDEPLINTTGGVRLPVVAQDVGSAGNLGAGALDQLQTVVSGITMVTNEFATTGGTDVESDDAFRIRILGQYQGQGAGNQNNYVTWALEYPGVERAVCVPIWNGPGTVLVVPMLADGSAVASTVVTGLQQQLDPIPGLGHGLAPIGATVTVATTESLAIAVEGTVVLAPGFTLDGAGGTIAVRPAIIAALASYLATLNPGDTVGYQSVLAGFFQVPGMIRINSMTVNGGTADIALGTSPPQTPVLPTPTLS